MRRGFIDKSSLILPLIFAFVVLPFVFSDAAGSKRLPLRIIVVRSSPEAKEILSRLKKGGSFAGLAAERSRDISRGKSGDLGMVDISRLEPPLRKAVSRLKEGEISGVIRVRKNRYAILQVLDFSHYRKGAASFREGQYDSAETELAAHIRQNPDAIKARVMLGEIYEKRNDPDRAEAQYREILSYDRTVWIAYVRLGKMYMQTGQYEKARDLYAQGFRYIPKAEGFRAGMKEAQDHLPNGDGKEAAPASKTKEAAEERAVAVTTKEGHREKPESQMPRRSSGGERSMHLRMLVVSSEAAALGALSDLKNGRSFVSIVSERSVDEKNREEYGYLGEVRLDSLDARIRDAVGNLRPGQASGPMKLEEGRYAVFQAADYRYFLEGEDAFIKEDFKTAEKKLLKHIELNEDDAGAYLMLGKIYEDRRWDLKAEEMYKKGLSYRPKAVILYLRLAKLYQMQRQFQKSRDILIEGFRKVPTSEQLAKGIEMVDIILFNESRKQ